jgi:hypothetical protein
VAGESVTLRCKTTGADVVELDGAAVAPSGEKEFRPTTTTTYGLVARNTSSGEEAQQSVEVTVLDTPQPVRIETLAAEPATIAAGESTTLSWRVIHPTTLDLDGEPVAPTGTLQLSPAATAEHLLTAQGHAGPVQRKVTITVGGGKRLERLPDRGGFLCALDNSWPALPAVSLGALVLLALLRVACRRRRC